jgi:hypothetical protein
MADAEITKSDIETFVAKIFNNQQAFQKKMALLGNNANPHNYFSLNGDVVLVSGLVNQNL